MFPGGSRSLWPSLPGRELLHSPKPLIPFSPWSPFSLLYTTSVQGHTPSLPTHSTSWETPLPLALTPEVALEIWPTPCTSLSTSMASGRWGAHKRLGTEKVTTVYSSQEHTHNAFYMRVPMQSLTEVMVPRELCNMAASWPTFSVEAHGLHTVGVQGWGSGLHRHVVHPLRRHQALSVAAIWLCLCWSHKKPPIP